MTLLLDERESLALLTDYRIGFLLVKINVSQANHPSGTLWPMARPKEPSRMEVADRLHSAAIHLLRHARQQDAAARQAPAQLSALSVLVFAGPGPGPGPGRRPMTLGQLAAAEQVKPPTMSRIVAGLKRSGLARIETDPNDARRIRVTATTKGERLLQQARVRRIRLLAKTLNSLAASELTTLFTAAELMERALRHSPKTVGRR